MGLTASLANWIDTAGHAIRSAGITQTPVFASRPGMAHVRFRETIIRYRVAGDGSQTLLLAADPPIVIEHYDELIGELQPDFRVVVVELPGFGFSLPRLGANFSFTPANDLVAAFLRQVAFGPYLLAFPCVSAYGAVDIAARYPDLVRGVVVIQAPAWDEEIKWKRGRDKTGVLSKPVVGQLALKALKRKRAPQWFEAAVGKRERLTSFIETADSAFRHGACFCLASAFQRYLTDTPPQLLPFVQPALVVWGDADRSHRRTDKASTFIYCPHAREVHIPAAGHFPELEEPQLFARALREWVRTIQS